MISLTVTTGNVLDYDLASYAFFLEYNFTDDQLSEAQQLFGPIASSLRERNFKGAAGSHVEISGVHNGHGVSLIFLGLGSRDDQNHLSVETYRRALGRLVRYTESHKLKDLGMYVPDAPDYGITPDRLGREIATMLHKASYHFDEFITTADRKLSFDSAVTLVVPQDYLSDIQTGVVAGNAIADAINKARYWCDLPPAALTPTKLADQAQDIAIKHNIAATILDEQAIIGLGMGGIVGVSKGSQEEARLVILEYKTTKPNAPTIALVGKGVTFDSGGLSLKPAVAMESMKDDMAGAVVVIATMGVIGQLKPHVNVIAFAPLAENMPSGTATRPGDILRFYNGKTAEVKNTDAEGRLILADALSYAIKNYKLDAIIDIATLTGACAQALGHFYAGLLTQHETLAKRIIEASELSGDRVWRLPMDNDYKPAVRSDVADICNIGSPNYKAGAITAAFFLQHFVGDIPWAHIDIAGTAFGVPDMSYYRPGATGFGIRLFVDLLMNWN